ncbi:hypothetical protein BC831DRAFT_474943 [Entophlyctis helioformis]|nr:hypothetical protein BC831DRAFT_474943 [Entophlyctis helioformis]
MGNVVSGMGDAVADKAKSVMMVSQVQSMRQMKNQRDMQLAISIAGTRDRVLWMGGAITTLGLVGVGSHLRGKKFPLPAIPAVIVSTLLAFQLEFAYGGMGACPTASMPLL